MILYAVSICELHVTSEPVCFSACIKHVSKIELRALNGEVSEWLKEHAWKVCIRQRIEGSNPSLTAKFKNPTVQPDYWHR